MVQLSNLGRTHFRGRFSSIYANQEASRWQGEAELTTLSTGSQKVANQFCGSLQGGGWFMKGKNCRPPNCCTKVKFFHFVIVFTIFTNNFLLILFIPVAVFYIYCFVGPFLVLHLLNRLLLAMLLRPGDS